MTKFVTPYKLTEIDTAPFKFEIRAAHDDRVLLATVTECVLPDGCAGWRAETSRNSDVYADTLDVIIKMVTEKNV